MNRYQRGGGLLSRIFCTGLFSGTNGPLEPVLKPLFPLVKTLQQVHSDRCGQNKKKQDGTLSFRCGQKGDFAPECTAVMCIYCDSPLHADPDCHLVNMPKPTATLYGICRESLMFFELPKTKGIRIRNDSGKICHIRITRGSMTVSHNSCD
jgi:hypothetical protein